MDVYLAPASTENLDKSIVRAIDKKILEKHLTKIEMNDIERIYKGKEIKCWGMNCGSGKYRGYFENFVYGDYIIFTPSKSGKFKYIGNIVYKIFNEDIGQLLWDFKGDKENDAWKYIMFVDEVKEIDIDKSKLLNLLGYKPKYPVYGLTKLSEDKKDIFFKSIYEINENKVLLNKNEESNINDKDIDKLLDKYRNNKIIGKIKKTIPNCYKENTDKSQKNKKRNGVNKATKPISSRNAKIIGLLGEKVIYETLLANTSDLLDTLNIKKQDITRIEWYNDIIDLFDESSYMKKDYSIGKGHDIKITTNNNEFLIEVKSSYGDSYQISPTSNEMKAMKENRNYYFFIVEKLKNIFIEKPPSVRIVESFSYKIPDEILSSISSINIYTNSDLIKYHTVF